MPNLMSESIFSSFYARTLTFAVASVAQSQTAVAMKVNVNDATSGSLKPLGFVAQHDGSIVGMTISLDVIKTAGVLTATPTINTTAITKPAALVAAALGNTVKVAVVNTDGQQIGARFKSGDIIGVKYTSDGSLLPNGSADLLIEVEIVYEGVQP